MLGEVGVIIGIGGFGSSKADIVMHVWSYTVINDVMAPKKQRDHEYILVFMMVLGSCSSSSFYQVYELK